MFPGFDLSNLPSLSLSQRNSLPACPAVYFAVDSKNRVLYVGKAINLLNRWKDHHRLEQIHRINRREQIKIAWLSCSNNLKVLADTENYFINFYQPLLNRTPVPAKKITPAEIVLQLTLSKLTKLDVVVFGFESVRDSFPPTVYFKYPIHIYRKGRISNAGPVNTIIQANNKRKTTGLRWSTYEREKFGQSKLRSWKSSCNGVKIELSFWKVMKESFAGFLNFRPKVGENTVIQTVAGVEMLALTESELANILNQYPFLRENYPRISALKHDPIPLLWSKQ